MPWKVALRCLYLGLAIPLVWATVWWSTRNCLTVVNESGQAVRELTVEVSGETFSFGDLAAGEFRMAHFRIEHEAMFDVRCRLADGTKVQDTTGYVLWEDDLLGASVTVVIGAEGKLSSFD